MGHISIEVPFQNIFSGAIKKKTFYGQDMKHIVDQACRFEASCSMYEIFPKWLEAHEQDIPGWVK